MRTRIGFIIFLFLAFRLSLLLFWPADQLARWSDYRYYYELAASIQQGALPYIDYWVEYPPLFPFLSLLIYRLTSHYAGYAGALALVQLAFEAGTLALLYRLARRFLDDVQAAETAWTYALLFAPLASWWLSFDSITTFFLVLAAERWVAGRRLQSALALGIGGMVKWFPLVFLSVAARCAANWRQAAGYAAVVLLVCLLVLAPLYALSPTYTTASLRTLGARSSWQTVWALLDGNRGTGIYEADRFDPAAASTPQGSPARVPTALTTLFLGALYLLLWLRRPATDGPRAVAQLTAFTLLILFLWSRGWSPQWLALLLPFVLLALPLQRAALYAIILTFVNLVEWPLMLSRGITDWLPYTIVLRTLVFVLLAVDVGVALWRRPAAPGAHVAGRSA